MAIQEIPNRCIWCGRDAESPNVIFSSDSHIIPKCLGNKKLILPPGVVCDSCNHNFHNKLEQTFIDDPMVKTLAGILRVRDAVGEFAYVRNKDGGPVNHEPRLQISINSSDQKSDVIITTDYKARQDGEVIKDDIIKCQKSYKRRELAFLSRAVYKIAFEYFAYSIFAENDKQITLEGKKLIQSADIFDDKYSYVREWVKEGSSQTMIREFLIFFSFGQKATIDDWYQNFVWYYDINDQQVFLMDLYGLCFAADLTSEPLVVKDNLMKLKTNLAAAKEIFMVGEKYSSIT